MKKRCTTFQQPGKCCTVGLPSTLSLSFVST
jgi:hypothetical protein